MNYPIKLEVFANTGHQFFEVPLVDLLPKYDDDRLSKLVKDNRGPWEKWSHEFPWVSFQYAMTEGDQSIPVIKIAIETNLGTPERGMLIDYMEDSESDDYSESKKEPGDLGFPYACAAEHDLESWYGKNRLTPLEDLPGNTHLDIVEPNGDPRLTIQWLEPDGIDPVDVDLVVDMGNTRSVALLLESPGNENTPFGRRVKTLRFLPRGDSYKPGNQVQVEECGIVNSFILLHKTLFADSEPPENKESVNTIWEKSEVQVDRRGLLKRSKKSETVFKKKDIYPQSFIELSPILLGGGTSTEGVFKILAGMDLESDALVSMSSPKRYSWDDHETGRKASRFWRQIRNRWEEEIAQTGTYDKLGGLFRYYMAPGSNDIELEKDLEQEGILRNYPDIPPTYPRRDAVCWFALSVLETAYRQINSMGYLSTAGRARLKRRLRNVRVTYPSGWTHEERDRYLEQWQRAVNLFAVAHFEDTRLVDLTDPVGGGDRPLMALNNLDESVCSQLPILYSQMRVLGIDGWLDLYGTNGKVTVMNVDIGGGTSDISVVEYAKSKNSEAKRISLEPKLLFRDGNSIAGDALVKRIIEKILIPRWFNIAENREYIRQNPEVGRQLKIMFAKPEELADSEPKISRKLERIVKLVFIPAVNEWLRRLSDSAGKKDETWDEIKIRDYGDPSTINEFNELVLKLIKKTPKGRLWGNKEPFSPDIGVHCTMEELNECIDDVFSNLFVSLSKTCSTFNPNMVIVSGKPSELPRINTLIRELFPVLPQRIIQVKNYPAGEWYPFASFDSGKIQDAKTCTVVGAALYQDMQNGNLRDLQLRIPQNGGLEKERHYWGLMPEGTKSEEFFKNENLLFQRRQTKGVDERIMEFDLPLNSRIGRSLYRLKESKPEPVYKLDWEPTQEELGLEPIAHVTLRWSKNEGQGESIELINVESLPNGPSVNLSNVSLKLNTLLEDDFWVDDPRLEVKGIG